MKDLGIRLSALTLAAAAVITAGCGTTGTNTNVANVNTRNLNSNTGVLVNSNQVTNTSSNRWANTNVSREDYNRDRSNYESDRGDMKIGTGANDSWLWFKTRAALMTTDDLRESTINVDVENDMITLRGTVGSAAQKAQAETVAKGIEGQKGVKNQLTVKAADSMTNQMVNGSSSSNARSNSNR